MLPNEHKEFFGSWPDSVKYTGAAQPDPKQMLYPNNDRTKPGIPDTVQRVTVPLKADTSVATKLDAGKTNWSLIPFEAVEEICKVLEFGALKYDGWNFAKGAGMNWSRITNSMLRHVFAWMRGEDKDPESGLSHLGHIGCNVIFLIYYAKYKEVYGAGDDRFKR